MHGGAKAQDPAMHGGGVVLPRGCHLPDCADMDLAMIHGRLGGPRRGSWRGMPAPVKMSSFAHHGSFLSLSHRGPLFLSLSHTRAPLFSSDPPRRPSPPLPLLGAPPRCDRPLPVLVPATPRLKKVNFLFTLRFYILIKFICLVIVCLVNFLLC